MTEMNQYNALMWACRILAKKEAEISREDGPSFISPAWSMVFHAKEMLTKEAASILRAEEWT